MPAENASTTVGQAVIDAVLLFNNTNTGKASIEVTQAITNNVKGDASISITTRDFVVDGTITLNEGILTWGEIEPNIPSIRIINAPSTLDIGKNVILQTEIKRVKDTPTISWTSNDLNEETASVNSEGKVTGIAEGDVEITAEIEVGGTKYSGTCQITIVTPPPAPQIGDFVNYNAGTWTEPEITALGSLYSVDASNDYTFGGFTEGSSRNTSVTPINSNKNGWQIFDTEEIDGVTYITKIISAGSPEKYNLPTKNISNKAYKSQYILGGGIAGNINTNDLIQRNWNMYRDSIYADSNVNVRLVTYEEMNNDKYTNIKHIGAHYWLPLAYNSVYLYLEYYYNNVLTDISYDGGTVGKLGIRPVITLKSGVTVKGTGTDHSTPDKAWKLQ